MRKIPWGRAAAFLLPPLLTAAVLTGVYLAVHGIPLRGLPKAQEVLSVEISDARQGGEPRVFADPEAVKRAVGCCGLLSWLPGAPGEEDLFLEYTFRLRDGTAATVSAGESTVFWQGRRRRLRDSTLFLSCTEGIFFAG